MCAALHEHTPPGCPRNTGEHGARRGDRQRTGAGRHEHRHRSIEARLERLVEHDPGEQQQHDEPQDYRDKDPLEAVGELLSRRLLRLGLGDQLDDPSQRALGGHAGHEDLERASAIDRPGEHAVLRVDPGGLRERSLEVGVRPLVDGHALAGDRRLIDASLAARDNAVGRDLGVRLHQ